MPEHSLVDEPQSKGIAEDSRKIILQVEREHGRPCLDACRMPRNGSSL
jgi:hypothetical protein